jgi:hypothetical protein
MKKTYIIYLSAFLIFISACNKQLDINPKGVLSEEQTVSPDGADKLVVAAYSQLGNDHYDVPYSLWPYGNGRSDDQYKGGRDEADIQNFHFIQTFSNTRVDFGEIDALWYNLYVGVGRANAALNIINQLNENEYPQKKVRQGEMLFLRGHFCFMLKTLFKYVPYIDEKVSQDVYDTVSNRSLTNDQLWEKIATDFQTAADNLNETPTQSGRISKAAAYAYLAKTRLYQAYTQDELNNVTGIDASKMNQVIAAADKVIASGHHLEPDFANNFLPGSFENGPESVFAIQYSHDDNTLKGRLNYGDVLSVPQGLGCCDFNKPSQNLVNAFHNGDNGVPLFDVYNNFNVNLATDFVDPRIDHTVAIPGHAWKYEPERIYEASWNRSPAIYGTYASLKENVSPDCDCFVNIDPFYGNSKNRIQIRFADVLLFKAEALIELNREMEALPLINQVRERAKQSTNMLKTSTGAFQAKYRVEPYISGTNITWNRDNARKALRFERRLEFAMENFRFFDLVRWGVAAETMNSYFNTEKGRRSFLNGAAFTKNKHEYLPIPLAQINFSKGLYKQNAGY